ncbi:hypothetical protein [Olivibacter ginsenosidimutans]|uniref:hypothetical protein n=1 Tax=Olivibacter ginsenosidimutans TaxID=1176537 RepID=UPI0031EABE59
MNQTRLISKILFYVTRIAAIAYLGTGIYSALCLISGWSIASYSNNQYLRINYPFSQKAFLLLENSWSYMLFSLLLPIMLYGIFFWLAANVFKVFFQAKLFISSHVLHLKRFYQLNVWIPSVATIVASFFVPIESVIWALVSVHLILGIFSYFLASIFTQGLYLQREQDLII